MLYLYGVDKMNKKKIIIIICIIILGCIIGTLLYEKYKFKLVINFSKTELEYGSEVYVNSIVEDSNVTIMDSQIDTFNLGDTKQKLTYLNNRGKEKTYEYSVTIIDTEKPLILGGNKYTTVGNDIDLLKSVICADNADQSPSCEVEGDYDITVAGKYNLKYVSVDSSNNKTTKDFYLSVTEPVPDTPTTPVEPTYINFTDILQTYKNDKQEVGIDISRWQGDIDFNKLKTNGVDFIMIRIGLQDGFDGDSELDANYLTNIKGATDAGIKVGLYYYSYAKSATEAIKQADWVVDNVGNYKIDLPIAFDWESWSNYNSIHLNLFEFNDMAYAFMNEMKVKGYETMLYGSKSYLTSMWKPKDYDVWLAQYNDAVTYTSKYKMWQLTELGKIDGIDHTVDIDILYLD